jgi:hypothetical protein
VRTIARIVTLLAAAVAVAAILHEVAAVPDADMSASRLVPAVALARGLPVYAGPDSGPIIDFMYGPVAAIAFLPAALAGTPSGALAIAVLVNAVAFFLPIGWLHRRVAGGWGWAGFVLFVLAVVRDPGLVFSALTIHADAPALGLGALACGLLATAPPPLTRPRLAAVALAAVLAAWTKQTTAPLVVALLAFAWLRDGRRAAVALGAWIAAVGLVVSAVCLVAFGPAELLFNMATLPARMPWYDEATRGRLGTALAVGGLLGRLAWLPAVVTAALLVALRRELRSAPTTLFAAVAVVLVPVAIVSAAKVGGYLNTFSVCTYFLTAAATLGLASVARAGARGGGLPRMALVIGVAGLGLAVARGPGGPWTAPTTLARLRAWADNPQEHAYAAARAHPGEIYFPWNPLATLLAENRLDNNEIGAWNRDLARSPIDDALWRSRLPPRLRLLASRPPRDAFTWLPPPTRRLPEFTEPATVAGLEGWTVLARPVATPSVCSLEPASHVAPPPHS